MAEELIPVAELAEKWRCSKTYIYELISRGQLRSINLGKGRAKTRIPESAVADFVKANTRSAA